MVNRLEESLDDSNLRKLFEKTNFKSLIDIYSTLMQDRFLDASNLDLDTVQLHKEVVELLQNKGSFDDDFLELLEILNKFEYDGLFQVLNYMVKCKKKTSLQDEEIQEEDSMKEDLEENVFVDSQKDESLIESISLKEEGLNEDEKSGNEIEIEKSIEEEEETEIDKSEIIHVQENDLNLNQSLKEDSVCIDSEKNLIKKESIEDKPPIPPPLPITIINSLNLEQNKANLITTTAEIPSLASLASNMQPISSTKPFELTNQMTQSISRSTHLNTSESQNILQNTFLTTVNNTLNNFVDPAASNLPQTPYYSSQPINIPPQQLLQQHQQQQNIIYNLPLDKQSIQPNLCNLEYSNLIQNRTNNLIHQTLTQNQAVTPIPVLGSFDLPLNNNVQLNELPTLPITNLPNVASLQSIPTISALDYANGAIPPVPPPPAQVQTQIITSLPPNLNNLPPNLPTNTKLSIVKIEKHSTEPLGATVKNEDDGRVTIGRIVCGGAAQVRAINLASLI